MLLQAAGIRREQIEVSEVCTYLHITDVCQLPPTHASTARGEDIVVFVDCSYKLINKGLQPSFECPPP